MRCPSCRESDLGPFFEAGPVPVQCNVLWPDAEAARGAATGRVHLGLCATCGLIFNLAFDAQRMVYDPRYENSLHFSPRFQEYAERLATRLIDTYDLRGRDVIEIGCGKGDFLGLLCRLGDNRGLGFDASYEGPPDEQDRGFRVIPEHYSAAHAKHTADLICCRHVLEHIADPRAFLDQVRAAASGNPGVAVFFEVPHALYTLRDLGIWDIIYEHCAYYTRPALERLFVESGFVPRSTYATFGEQFLCIEAGLDSGDMHRNPKSADVEGIGGLAERFAAHFRDKVAHWSDRLQNLLNAGHRVAIWGAGSKGVTFLNTVEGGRGIACAVDINPRKQGRFVPVTGQPVVAPASLPSLGVDFVLVMNPLYEPEIRGMLAESTSTAELLVV